MKERFEDRLKEVLEIKEVSPVKSSGINSNIYKVTSADGGRYALKLYRDTKRFEGHSRSEREVVFTTAIETFLDSELSVPKVVFSSGEGCFTLFEWSDLRALDVTTKNLLLILEFIKKIQGAREGYVVRAKECRLRLGDHFNLVVESIQCLSQEVNTKDLGSFGTYIASVLKDSLEDLQKLETSMSTEELNKAVSPILSHSDVGFHNMGMTKTGILFFDFEYAGLDDPRKLYADIMLQPRYIRSLDTLDIEEKVRLFISELIGMEQDKEGLSRMLSLYRHKWIAIMIKYMTSASYTGSIGSCMEVLEGYRSRSKQVTQYG